MLDQRFPTPWLISLALKVFVKYSSHLIPREPFPLNKHLHSCSKWLLQCGVVVLYNFGCRQKNLGHLKKQTKMWYWSQFASTHILTPLIVLVVDTELNWNLLLLGILVSSRNLELYISRQWSLKTCSGGVSRTDEFELHGEGFAV